MVVAILLKTGQLIIKNRKINVKPVKGNLSPITPKYTSTITPIELIDKLLLEKISLAGIIPITGVSEKWMQNYVNRKYAEVSQSVQCTKKKPGD